MNNNVSLPDGWKWLNLHQVTADRLFCDGDWIESEDQDPNGDVRLIQLSDIGEVVFKNKSNRYLTTPKANELKCTFLNKNDVLIARMPDPLGRACVFPLNGELKYVTAVDVSIVRVNEQIVNPKYLAYIINAPQSRNSINALQSGSTRKRISRKNLGTIEFPVPSIETQNRIIEKIEELFSELDHAEVQLLKAKKELRAYKQSVLKYAFDGYYSDGKQDWLKLKIKDLVIPNEGLRRGPFGSAIKKSFFVSNGYKVYEQGNAINDDPYRGNYYINEEKYNELESFKVLPHDLIVSCSGVTLGRISEIPNDAAPGVINQALLRIRLNRNIIHNQYFIHLFRSDSFQRLIFSYAQGSAMPNMVGLKELKEVFVEIPNMELQKQIVDVVEEKLAAIADISNEVNAKQNSIKHLRQSILHEAFTGQLIN